MAIQKQRQREFRVAVFFHGLVAIPSFLLFLLYGDLGPLIIFTNMMMQGCLRLFDYFGLQTRILRARSVPIYGFLFCASAELILLASFVNGHDLHLKALVEAVAGMALLIIGSCLIDLALQIVDRDRRLRAQLSRRV